ncbi:DUF3331 domain-containing protein [Paraburkholderia sp.]|uniref:DUF3331 domain-containing protein n=1 Tax=Paraburkholderia sp. TaxID=1926495 RepID=UPI00286F95E2|nr:DUF3331 domain-containing protein [Paraburkholderia sp.]
MRQLSGGNAWQYTLNLLGGGSVLHAHAGRNPRRACASRAAMADPSVPRSVPALRAHLAFVEAWSENLISVSWSDPTSGRYAEQPWRLCIARKRGLCALTGADIQRGDKIYRPFTRGVAPINADWAVLASALEQRAKA